LGKIAGTFSSSSGAAASAPRFPGRTRCNAPAPLILTATCVCHPGANRTGHHRRRGRAGARWLRRGRHRHSADRLGAGLSDDAARCHGDCRHAGAGSGSACVGALKHYRGVNETISSLLLFYIAVSILNFFVEGALRDPADPNKPSTMPIGKDNMIGNIPGTDVHWGLVWSASGPGGCCTS
jgi:hypothetical protein